MSSYVFTFLCACLYLNLLFSSCIRHPSDRLPSIQVLQGPSQVVKLSGRHLYLLSHLGSHLKCNFNRLWIIPRANVDLFGKFLGKSFSVMELCKLAPDLWSCGYHMSLHLEPRVWCCWLLLSCPVIALQCHLPAPGSTLLLYLSIYFAFSVCNLHNSALVAYLGALVFLLFHCLRQINDLFTVMQPVEGQSQN